MHMSSKKDLSKAEIDILTKSCCPTMVITANGEVQTHKESIVLRQRIGYNFDYESPREHASSIVVWKGNAMKTGIPTNGSIVKNHGEFSFQSWFLV